MGAHSPVIEAFVDETLREGIERCPFLLSEDRKFQLLDAMVAAGLRQFCVNSGDPPAFTARFLRSKLEANAYPQDARLVLLVAMNTWEHSHELVRTIPREHIEDIIFMFGGIDYKNEQRTFERAFSAFAEIGARRTRFSIVNNFAKGFTEEKYELIRQQIERCIKVGIREGRVNDSLGSLLPDTTAMLSKRLVADFPQVTFYLHAHNDLGMAVANVMASVDSGFRMVEGTLAGFANRSGLPAHEIIDKICKLHHIRVENVTINSDKLIAAARLAEQMFMVVPNVYRPVSGIFTDKQTVTMLNVPDFLGLPGTRDYYLSFASLELPAIKRVLAGEGFDRELVEDAAFIARVSQAIEQRMQAMTEERENQYGALMRQIHAFHQGLTKTDMIEIAKSCARETRPK